MQSLGQTMESSRVPLIEQQPSTVVEVHPAPEYLETINISKEERFEDFMLKTKKHTSALKGSPNLAIYDDSEQDLMKISKKQRSLKKKAKQLKP